MESPSLSSESMAEMEPERATLHQQLTAVLSGALWDRGHDIRKWIVAPMTALQAAAAEFFRPAPPSASGDEAKALEAARNQRLAAILAPYAPER